MKCAVLFLLVAIIDSGFSMSQPRGVIIPKTAIRAFGFSAIWNRNYGAKTYEARILKDYSMEVIKTIKDIKSNRVVVRGLKAGGLYGIEIIAVDRNNQRSPPSKAVRVRTLKEPEKVIPPRPSYKWPIGSCGVDKFTCGDKACIDGKLWCDGKFQCDDRSDEKDCPGSCPKLDFSSFINGNYTCTMFESPQSVCSFTCYEGFERDGPFYVRCRPENSTWTGNIPQCRLQAPVQVKPLPELTEKHSVKFTWNRVQGASGYKVASVETKDKDDDEFKKVEIKDLFTKVVDKPSKLLAKVKTLAYGTQYRVQIMAVDENDVEGFPSTAVVAATQLGRIVPIDKGN